jgi:hypothetical protein
MKTETICAVLAVSLVLAGCGKNPSPPEQTSKANLPEVRKERREHRGPGGGIDAYVDTFYRGKERILIQAAYTVPTPSGIKMWREYVVDRKTMVKEMDYGDGKPQLVLVYRDGSLFEAFHRSANASVEPISSDELAKTKAETQEFMAAFEGVIGRVRERAGISSSAKAVDELKTELKQYQQSQKKEGDVDRK